MKESELDLPEDVLPIEPNEIINTALLVSTTSDFPSTPSEKRIARIAIPVNGHYYCHYCNRIMTRYGIGKKKGSWMTVDHLYPKHKGGKLNIENIRASCYSCNSKRSQIDGAKDINAKRMIYSTYLLSLMKHKIKTLHSDFLKHIL